MQFKLTKSHLYWWPVKVRIPDPETPGKIIEQVLQVQFQPKDREALLASQEEAAKLTSLRELTAHEVREAHEIIRDWDGVVGEDGQKIPFTQGNLDLALQQPWFRKGVTDALAESMNGEEARRGN